MLHDLGEVGLVTSDGNTETALQTWRLTERGRTAAKQVLPAGRYVGSIAKGTGSHGAAQRPHTPGDQAGRPPALLETKAAEARERRRQAELDAERALREWHEAVA
ncbi:hypothetical protein [Streptacidiphilus carbonis]|uniref:hypothetical protein n=1 Tax=Streptacidiphilus carbonis TaxID=105422 RepID=UPI0005A8C463|nr:hypothetical protein [Streptacidiphilus carbonis]